MDIKEENEDNEFIEELLDLINCQDKQEQIIRRWHTKLTKKEYITKSTSTITEDERKRALDRLNSIMRQATSMKLTTASVKRLGCRTCKHYVRPEYFPNYICIFYSPEIRRYLQKCDSHEPGSARY